MKIFWIVALVSIGILLAQTVATVTQWPVAGQNPFGTRSQANETTINTGNAGNLSVKWTFTTGGDVSATPAVGDSAVYFPDWAGNLYAVNKPDGQVMWQHAIADYDGVPGAISRVTPALHNDDLIIGDIQNPKAAHNGASIIAVNRTTGDMHWITKVDTHLAAQITGAPVVMGDVVYVGVSSNEENLAMNDSYPCCTFRGSMVALNANTGAILWKTYTVPDNNGQTGGYSGGAIWQPPAIDTQRGSLFTGTGNNYTVPQSVLACQESVLHTACNAADDYFDAAMALDLATGSVKWAHPLEGADTWTVACLSMPKGVNCPLPASPDYDFSGSGPNRVGNIIGFGQKSGIYWALNPDNGAIVWTAIPGPGGTLGGIEWGTATDGQRIYAAITNNSHTPYTLVNGQNITWGSWSAIDVATGKIVWQTADPTAGAMSMGAVSVANGVAYAGSMSGHMYGMDSATGKILFDFMSGGSVLDGPSIADGVVYWGSGYAHISGTANNKVFAFAVK
ncbi:MAG TPA: PQQ-binding-like beta-propeller repeat protein [Bryobacteraceae bacterium]